MGRFDFYIPEDFLHSLGKMSEIEEIIPEMLKGAAPILKERLEQELAKHRDTGAMIKSIKITKPKQSRIGDWYISIGPRGKDPVTGVRNMEKLAILEYGKSGQPAQPMMDRIQADAMPAAIERMQAIFDELAGIKK